MKASRYVVMGVAALAAILLAFLVRGMVAGKSSKVAKAETQAVASMVPQTVKILVAARDLKPGDRLTEADLVWKDWPQNLLNPIYILDSQSVSVAANPVAGSEEAAAKAQKGGAKKAVENVANAAAKALTGDAAKMKFVGGVVREGMLANEPIIESKIVKADEGGFMAVMLEPGRRAMAVPVNVESTAGGFILPGDHVDVLVTVTVPRDGKPGNYVYVSPVLSNIKVLAVDQQVVAEQGKQTVIGATATLAVKPEEAEILALAKGAGSLSLTLRSYADVGGRSAIEANRPEGASAGSGSEEQSVRVYRNGQASEVTVSR